MAINRFLYGDFSTAAGIHFHYPGREYNTPVIRLLPTWLQQSGFDHCKARRTASGVLLKWKIKNPQRDDTFHIFRHTAEKKYERIGLVPLDGLADGQDEFAYVDTQAPAGACSYKIERYRFHYLLAASDTNGLPAICQHPFITCATYPAVVTDKIGIQLYASAANTLILSLRDDKGRLLLEKPVRAETGINHFIMSLVAIQPGYYSLQLQHSGSASVIKKRIQVGYPPRG